MEATAAGNGSADLPLRMAMSRLMANGKSDKKIACYSDYSGMATATFGRTATAPPVGNKDVQDCGCDFSLQFGSRVAVRSVSVRRCGNWGSGTGEIGFDAGHLRNLQPKQMPSEQIKSLLHTSRDSYVRVAREATLD